MKDIRTRIATYAVILGLGGLGGYAMSQNHASTGGSTASAPAPTTQVIRRTVHAKANKAAKDRASGGPPRAGASAPATLASRSVSTGSSGSSGSMSPAPSSPPPVQTHSSGGGSSSHGGGGNSRPHVTTHTSGGGGGRGGGEHEHEGRDD